MYFAIAYDLWPHLTGRALPDLGLVRTQLWLWFIGMIVTTFPWHWVGILGMPRRMAYFDYSDPGDRAAGVLGHVLGDRRLHPADLGPAVPRHPGRGACAARGRRRPLSLQRARASGPLPCRSRSTATRIWVALMIGLTVTNYGYPILKLARRVQDTSVPAVYVGAQ